MDTAQVFTALRRGWVLIVAALVAGGIIASLFSLLQRPLYQSTAKVFVSVDSAANSADLSQGSTFTQQAVKSYADVVRTPIVLDEVIGGLGLNESASKLASNVSTSVPTNEVVLEITVTDASPTRAASIVNAITVRLSAVVADLTADSTSSAAVKVTTLQRGTVPSSAISPTTARNIAAGLIIGLVLGALVALAHSLLDTRLRDIRDIERVSGGPLIGRVPFDTRLRTAPLALIDQPSSSAAEAFRTLQANLQFVTINHDSTLIISSSAQSEGKSTTAVNLAIAAAAANARVLLIDADLRRPQVGSYLGLDDAVGLTDVLIGRAALEQALQTWGSAGLVVLPAGATPPNPGELLQSAQMGELLSDVKSRFDMVIIDTAPLLVVADTNGLLRHAPNVLIVAAINSTRAPTLASAALAVGRAGGQIVGSIASMVPMREMRDYGYGYGYYGKDSSGAQTTPHGHSIEGDQRSTPISNATTNI